MVGWKDRKKRRAAVLVLDDGRVFHGRSFGAEGEARVAEVVFNTALSGYQEILTDPSYEGQFVVYTMPIIGIYGVCEEDSESHRPHARGMIVRECSRTYSNFRAQDSVENYLIEHDIVGIEGVDTRALVLHIREAGTMNGIISTDCDDIDSLRARLAKAPSMAGLDLAKVVTCKEPYEYTEAGSRWQAPWGPNCDDGRQDWGRRFKVVVVDFGVKRSILRSLTRRGCDLQVVPADTAAEEILGYNPDGVFLSNGPGDPEPVTYAVETTKNLIGKVPMMGICLGHQILALAFGGRTYKLKFGHRGGNHPVIEDATGVVAITSQNHGFAVEADSLSHEALEITHRSLNDGTVEGLRHKEYPIFSIQFHPEAGPGPHDGEMLFDQFMELMGGTRQVDAVPSTESASN
jgi:carbamoyl-phosphate synthase small subunit